MSDNRINPASADRKNPYADLGPRDPQSVNASPPVSAPPAASEYPNPLAQAPKAGANPWASPPSYQPRGTTVNPWATPKASTARQSATQQPTVPQFPASQPTTPQPALPQSAGPQYQVPRPTTPTQQWNQNGVQIPQQGPRPKRRWVMALVVGIIALLVGFAMGESSAKQETQAQIDDLWAENYELRTELDDSESRVEDLQQQLEGESDSSSSPADPNSLDPWWDFGSDAAGTQGFPGDGVYMVGFSIEPGTYSTGARVGCVWTRVSGDYAIEDVGGTADTPTEVVIEPSDLAFMTSGCEDWVRVD